VSFVELYCNEIIDLQGNNSDEEKLKISENVLHNFTIPGFIECTVENKNEAYNILKEGVNKRQNAYTLLNNKSSRSHSIFTVTVIITGKSIEGDETIKVRKLNLVDLAVII
jgi:kinesin family member 11